MIVPASIRAARELPLRRRFGPSLKNILSDGGTSPDGTTIDTPAQVVFQALATRAGCEVISADSY